LLRLWRRAGRGRGVRPAQIAAFAGGWLALVAALVSPIDALGEWLFSAHMTQHELLMINTAPLLVLGRPLAVWALALRKVWSRAAGHFFHTPGWRVPWLIVTARSLLGCCMHWRSGFGTRRRCSTRLSRTQACTRSSRSASC
jgi:putative membrane protein